MSIQMIADQTIAEIHQAIAGKLSEDELGEVTRIIQNGILRSKVSMPEICRRQIVWQSGPEADKAHKIAENLDCKFFALEANLSSQR